MTRLPPPYGRRIDRSRPLRFTFEGRAMAGLDGDSIASALAANGQWMLSRSFKYHRPRGAMSFAGSDANTLVQVGAMPNVAADLTPLRNGMEITAQNVSGSLEHDRDAAIGVFARFLPVGFYYRTFIGPTRGAWLRLWEPLIRAKAGLGVIAPDASAIPVDKATLQCDVAVIGGGMAGMRAALEAAHDGADVMLVDDQPSLGGQAGHGSDTAEADALAGEVAAHPAIHVRCETSCTGLFEDNWLALSRLDRLWRLRAGRVVLATGGIDQIAVFRNNDLPGILTAGGARRLLHLYGVAPGRRVVVLAATPVGYEVARELCAAGVPVGAIVDPVAGGCGTPPDGVAVIAGRMEAAIGSRHITGVQVAGQELRCDALVVAAGQMPAWHLPCQAGARLSVDADGVGFDLDDPTITLAGALAGEGADPPALLPLEAHARGKDFVDFDEDLQIEDIRNAIREGYRELELVKRFSTVGMGPSQGRHSALPTARIVAAETGRDLVQIGVTTARPPTAPETLGALAGPQTQAERRTALDRVHRDLGADMRPVGAWWRPYVYAPGDQRAARIIEEVRAVRNGAGVLDVSTLGKLEVRGPDAGAFLDRIYTMAHANQPLGKVRYCLMLNEMGTVIDDGVALRLAEDRFYVTATTGAVGRVYADMAFWNAQWRMDVDVVNLTAGFAALNITGPRARAVLKALDGDIDFSRDGFAYLTGRSGTVAGVPVHAMRIGFTGELSFELHCPASRAHDLWDAVMAAGMPHGLRPYGLEASRILRLEKGHILIGQDTDALTSPHDLGFGWAISKKKPFFVGKRALEMRLRLGATRKLAALRFDAGTDLADESCLVIKDGRPVGHVTSCAHSPTLNHGIALAFVAPEDAEPGRRVDIRARNGRVVQGTVCGHAFVDPDGERQAL